MFLQDFAHKLNYLPLLHYAKLTQSKNDDIVQFGTTVAPDKFRGTDAIYLKQSTRDDRVVSGNLMESCPQPNDTDGRILDSRMQQVSKQTECSDATNATGYGDRNVILCYNLQGTRNSHVETITCREG